MYETVTLQSWTTTQCLLDWSSIEDHYKTLEHHCILYQVLLCKMCVECTERAMKEKNNARKEGHAEEREEMCMLHTFIDYLAFLYTPPLSEVGTQVDRSRVPDTPFVGISSAKIIIGQCTRNY